MVHQQQTLSTIGRAMVGCLALLTPALVLSSGCATTNVAKAPETPPKGAPGQIVATWNKDVEFLPDRVNNGRLTPALSGRVYFFEGGSTEQKPIVADGSLFISVYDEHGKTNPDGTPVPLEVWQITPECMKLVMTKDWWGWGYTLNLPWNTYRPDISQVRFQVRYVPPKDAKDPMPVFSDCPMLALQHPGSTTQSTAQANARNPSASQQRTSGYTQSGVQPATSLWQVNLPANRNLPTPAPVSGANPAGTIPSNPENSSLVVPVSAVGSQVSVPPAGGTDFKSVLPGAPTPGVLQAPPRYPQVLPPVNSPAAEAPVPPNGAAAQGATPLISTVPQPAVQVTEPHGPRQAYSAGAFAKPLSAAALQAQMPVNDSRPQGPAPIDNPGPQPLGPAIDNSTQSATQSSSPPLAPPVQASVGFPPPPPPPPSGQPSAPDASVGGIGSAGVTRASNVPMPGQMLSMPGSKSQ